MWMKRVPIAILSLGMIVAFPADEVISAKSETIQSQSQTTIFSFYDSACAARWRAGNPQGKEVTLPCPGSQSDDRGFVRQLSANFNLETDRPANRSIQTHPQWTPHGYIFGEFSLGSLGITLQSGDRFESEVGFLSGAQEGNVRFSIYYDASPGQSGGEVLLAEVEDSYDGKLRNLNVNLSNFSGGSGAIVLHVDALDSSAQDWAVWVDPRLEREAAHPPTSTPTTQPTSMPTPTPTSTMAPTIAIETPSVPEEAAFDLLDGFAFITSGPIMPGAFDDGDNDGVLNVWDQCPNTPAGYSRVFENGCLCQDSDGGLNLLRQGTVSYILPDGEGASTDVCVDGNLREYTCNPSYEEGVGDPILSREFPCPTFGSIAYHCTHGRCIPRVTAIPNICWSSEGTCADGIQNQNEEGVDCGGRCPPCNTECTSGTKYAPPDTPCTSYYPTDMYRIDWPWTENELEYTCQFHEVCHPDLDHVIEEAARCCSIGYIYEGLTADEEYRRVEADIDAMPDPDLCREARRLTASTTSCKRCIGMYIIKGLGSYGRWMVGYNWLYPEHNVYGDVTQLPAEQLINDYQTGICRDYAEALTTLLRKAGYSATEVGDFCDGGHCYNVVKLPGDSEWHIVDTTGNAPGIILGGLPGGHPYCTYLNEMNWCWNGQLVTGESCTGSEPMVIEGTFSCSPGMACNRDVDSVPDWAPSVDDLIGCP